jgi:hypothetical protein
MESSDWRDWFVTKVGDDCYAVARLGPTGATPACPPDFIDNYINVRRFLFYNSEIYGIK